MDIVALLTLFKEKVQKDFVLVLVSAIVGIFSYCFASMSEILAFGIAL